jgi:hypothetical protein
MSASQNEKKEQKQNSPQPGPQQPQTQYHPQKRHPQKQYYRKNYHRGYQRRRGYQDNYQGDKNHARIVVSIDVYRKLVQYVLKYYGTLKGMSKITSELLDKAIDMDIADKENRKRYADEMHLHSEV